MAVYSTHLCMCGTVNEDEEIILLTSALFGDLCQYISPSLMPWNLNCSKVLLQPVLVDCIWTERWWLLDGLHACCVIYFLC